MDETSTEDLIKIAFKMRTDSDIAKRIGVSTTTVNKWRRGHLGRSDANVVRIQKLYRPELRKLVIELILESNNKNQFSGILEELCTELEKGIRLDLESLASVRRALLGSAH